MIYLPDEWLVNPVNEERVRELLEDLYSDLKFEDSLTRKDIIKELKKIGETKIIQEYIDENA